MEIKKNRLGHDRSYEKVDSNRIRVTGKSKFTRASENDDGVITMFDFEEVLVLILEEKLDFNIQNG